MKLAKKICFLTGGLLLGLSSAVAQLTDPSDSWAIQPISYAEQVLADEATPLSASSLGEWHFARPADGNSGLLTTDIGETFIVSPVDTVLAQHTEVAGGKSGTGAEAEENNGTNPAQNARTAVFQNSYLMLEGGNQINTAYARMKFPMFGGRGSYMLEVPFNYYDLEFPVAGQVGGLGDIKFQFSYNTWTSENKRLTFLTFLEVYIPSADNFLLTNILDANDFIAAQIGTGKYTLGPGLGFVYALRKNTIFAPLYFYEASVAGNEARPDIDRGKWRVFLMNSWQNGMYVLPEVNIVTNYLNGETDTYVAPEIGLSRKGTTLYAKPGVGIDPGVNERDWGIEFGARVMF